VSKNGEPPAKKAKKAEEADKEEPETKMVKHNLKFCSLEDALKVDWTAQDLARRIKRMDPSFFVLQVESSKRFYDYTLLAICKLQKFVTLWTFWQKIVT